MKIRNLLLVSFLIGGTTTRAASIQYISIGVNGLTCSMCTRNVEKSILKLDFVDSVAMDLDKTEGIVYLKRNRSVDLRKVAKAVTNAGYSVRFLRIQVDFGTAPLSDCFSIGPDSFQFLSGTKRPAGTKAVLTLIGDEFMPRKEFALLRKQMVEQCPSKNGFYVGSL